MVNLATMEQHFFTYATNGLRTLRTVGDSKVYRYVYDGNQLKQMTVGNDTLYFTYDINGAPMSVTLNGTTYYYVTNLQGDVVAILNSAGNMVVDYVYDAWGNILASSFFVGEYNYATEQYQYSQDTSADAIGRLNPLRYRSYVFDSETRLYYLQSRYYNPEWGRFITADSIDYLGADGTIASYNLFAYCSNNPVMYSDPTGNSITIATLILIGSAIVGAAATAYTAYVEYQAGFDTVQIIGDSICAGFAAFSIVYSGGMSLYQCYQNYCYLNGLTPVTQIGGQSNLTAQLQACANTANTTVSGTGTVAGTYKHTAFSAEVNKLGNPTLRTEISYLNGREVAYGTKGSIRFDVVQINAAGVPVVAWDFKTGAAILTENRINQMLERSGLNIPIYMIK